MCLSFRKLLLGFYRYQAEIFCVDFYQPAEKSKQTNIFTFFIFYIFYIFLQICSRSIFKITHIFSLFWGQILIVLRISCSSEILSAQYHLQSRKTLLDYRDFWVAGSKKDWHFNRWLAQNEQEDEAMNILVKMAKVNRKTLDSISEAKMRQMVAEIGMCQIFCQRFLIYNSNHHY